MSSMPGDVRPLAQLLLEQVQFANLLLLNKTDLVTPAERQKVEQFLGLLNPSTRIVPTSPCGPAAAPASASSARRR